MVKNTLRIVLCGIAVILLVSCAMRSGSDLKYDKKDNVSVSNPSRSDQSASIRTITGWQEDPLDDVWTAWLKSCSFIQKNLNNPFKQVCLKARSLNNPTSEQVRQYFETNFQATALYQTQADRGFPQGSSQGLITGYYEPVLKGSLTKKGIYQTPIHAYPSTWRADTKRLRPPRAELMASGLLKGQEIVWVSDPIEAAFLQIQGSGKILLEDGKTLRLSFDGTNNQPFTSFANWLIQKKEMTLAQANMQNITKWAKTHPDRVQELLNANPRYVFFKINASPASEFGPIGALGEPLTKQRSIAVDWQYIPKGAPVFLRTTDPKSGQSLQRLVFAQDTGNAIVGSVRADYYWGSGEDAGEKAGMTKHSGTMWLLRPIIE